MGFIVSLVPTHEHLPPVPGWNTPAAEREGPMGNRPAPARKSSSRIGRQATGYSLCKEGISLSIRWIFLSRQGIL
uniref:Uncharacterized protein n=1 Tax=Candidatus Kentrum sp. FM TaxID=2126340 RepID=A0A450W358_9GAMM|nr:MAG: hypothetical protein BECKFM1743C_GA0114222_1001715 [Candidatus Kentron sp. FM]VFJ77864.1 MAG: hypothetical protein BECKFM1743A_GA0114220_110391 [Candidatus Kentron sp. FM]VFK11449.1 MAG: hypothetical protein BECKFM1743B_GA0114221_1018215 [Candidatus Kentron sp. FM]